MNNLADNNWPIHNLFRRFVSAAVA